MELRQVGDHFLMFFGRLFCEFCIVLVFFVFSSSFWSFILRILFRFGRVFCEFSIVSVVYFANSLSFLGRRAGGLGTGLGTGASMKLN